MNMKKFILSILPAFMLLASCGAKPQVANDVMLEDTLAHEEAFGAEPVGEQLMLDVHYNTPGEGSLIKPVVGVQYKDDGDGKFAIRYVAAINAVDVEAVWTRGVCGQNGTQLKTFATFESHTAYTALSADAGSEVAVPSLAGEDYNYFVVYTLRNVPAADLNAYLFAYLTISKGTESIKSDARISRVSGGDTFTIDTDTRSGYFAHGTIGGTANSFESIPYVGDTSPSNLAEIEGLSLNMNDEFALFKYEPDPLNEHFQCFGSYDGGINGYCKTLDNNNHRIYQSGSFNIYINKSNTVYFNGSITAERFYLNAVTWENEGSPRFALYAYKDAYTDANEVYHAKVETWIEMTADSGDHIYYADLEDYESYDNVIFCRMNPANPKNDWASNGGAVWNQSYDLGRPAVTNTERVYCIDNYNNSDPCPGHWYSVDYL